MLNVQDCESGLITRFGNISVSEPATEDGVLPAYVVQELQFKVLARLLEFLGANSGVLPSKEDLLEALSKAIDMAFTAINKPFIASILKPIVKTQLLKMASDLYDRIVNPVIEV